MSEPQGPSASSVRRSLPDLGPRARRRDALDPASAKNGWVLTPRSRERGLCLASNKRQDRPVQERTATSSLARALSLRDGTGTSSAARCPIGVTPSFLFGAAIIVVLSRHVSDAGMAPADCRLPQENIQRVVRDHSPSIRECYARALTSNHALRGRVEVRFVIGPDGTVIFAAAGSSDLPAPAVVRCVVDVVRTLTGFVGAARNAVVVYPFMFTPGGGALPAHAIERVLDDARPRFRICYERARYANPSVEGTVRIRFVVGVTGDVIDAVADRSTLEDQGAVACILHMIEGLSFPISEGGNVEIVQTLTFRE
jgi:outer membrane biosynthesis protein TonB